ncbi:PAS domain S-box protein [Pelagibaculum spongiae]|uniref:histidine kinase n=1 Tax=Pelagibaculum spongiae TaxID=2080658 RepID=A0A2V1H5J5_9GAMM|nr:PAS domain S-box protein [Pelagibaculum spongiae]PVZ72477.1 hypothetical protein DC094_05600 [Pelagibaculum spongiae]
MSQAKGWGIRVIYPLLGLTILAVIFIVHFQLTLAVQVQSHIQQQRLIAEQGKQLIETDLSELVSDLQVLATLAPVNTLAQKGSLQIMAQQFLAVAKNKNHYDQIRVLNPFGKELIRVDRRLGPGLTPAHLLQDKSGRYYVNDMQKLTESEVYLSPLDFNIEFGVVETPHRLVLRMGRALYNDNGEKVALLLVNYDGDRLKRHLQQIESTWPGGRLMLSDDVARLLPSQPDPLPSPLIQAMANQQRGLIQHNDFSWNFIGIRLPNKIRGQTNWTVISALPPSFRNQLRSNFWREQGGFYTLLGLLVVLSSIGISQLVIRNSTIKQLHDREKSFRKILERLPLAAVVLDRDFQLTFVNHAILGLFNLPRDGELPENDFAALVDIEECPLVEKRVNLAFDKGIAPPAFKAHLQVSGERRLINWHASLIDTSDGPRLALIGEDLTEHETQQAQLHRLSRAIEQSPSMVIITNIDGIVEYVNPSFGLITGYSMREIIGQTIRVLKSGRVLSEVYRQMWQTLQDGREWVGELENLTKAGNPLWVRVSIAPVINDHGETTHYVAVEQDITAEKALQASIAEEQAMRQRNDQMAAVGRAANMIAHDLRNPLSSVKMSLQMGRKRLNATDPDTAEIFGIALDQVTYMEDILSDLLSYSRPNQLQPEWIAINPLLESQILSLQGQIEQNNLTMNQSLALGLPTIYADPTKLRQLLQNLLENAVQAASEVDNGWVNVKSELRFTPKGQKLIISVENNGQPVDRETADRMFEPFFTTRAKGTGLGLAIVRRILDQHRAQCRVQALASGGLLLEIEFSLAAG